MTYLIIGILAAAVVAFLVLRRRHRAAAPPTSVGEEADAVTDEDSRKYHSVSIKAGLHKCSAVQELEGVRIMSAEAPRLPLPDCDVDDCSCRYVHHDERRVAGDRRSPFSAGGAWQRIGDPDKDKRSGHDRRQDDNDDYR